MRRLVALTSSSKLYILALGLWFGIVYQTTSGFAPQLQQKIHRWSSTKQFSTTTNDNNNSDGGPLVQLDPSKTAFVMIEYQNEFCSPGGKFHDGVKDCMDRTKMLSTSITTIEQARSLGCTIIHCPINFEYGHEEISKTPYGILAGVKDNAAFIAGTWGADFVQGMKPMKGDLIVKGKSGLCGFTSTNLDFLLRQNSIQNVVLGGFLTNCCVESTMRTAYEFGYKVYTLTDCVAATSVAAQEATIQYNFGMFSIPTTSADIINAITKSSYVTSTAITI